MASKVLWYGFISVHDNLDSVAVVVEYIQDWNHY